ncbi:MAG TPA: diguanylate cyclase, partial [Pseudolabrys sp.]|nr:diguanylate cyclase [Pseudolabrys sp.]
MVSAVARPRASDARQYTSWDRARLSVVVPIGVIVAVAIVCIVVAVLSSAQRADVVAIDHEKQLFSRAITNYGERVLREVESVASSTATIQNVRRSFDRVWAKDRVGNWLETYFDHDYVFIFDRNDELIYSLLGNRAADAKWLASARSDFVSVIEYMRGRDPTLHGAIRLNHPSLTEGGAHPQSAVIRRVMGKPAVIAAVAVGPVDGIPQSVDGDAPIIMSVKFIDDSALSIIAAQLRLVNLRKIDQAPVPQSDLVFDLTGPDGSVIARFAWTPKQPGAEIVHNVVPFIAVALTGFALLAAFVRYMRRTAAAIAAGESRLRHLALHDPLCGLPNRIFFGERLEAVIEEVRNGSTPAAVFYIDLDHFKDVNDTLGHHVGDELIRNVTLRLSHTLRGGDLVARLGGDEFAVISSIAGDSEKMMGLAQRIISAICASYSISGQNIIIGSSIGIAVIEKNCGTATDIMRYADMALYRAKNEGR